jgi:hypothetical protein
VKGRLVFHVWRSHFAKESIFFFGNHFLFVVVPFSFNLSAFLQTGGMTRLGWCNPQKKTVINEHRICEGRDDDPRRAYGYTEELNNLAK